MRVKFLSLAVCAGLAAVPSAGQAKPVNGLYVAASGGYNILQSQPITTVGTPFGNQPGGNIKADGGPIFLGSIGWGFGNGLRAEVEGSYRQNSFYRATAGALNKAKADGGESKTSIFFNVLFDFDLERYGITEVTPYVGAGVGYSWASWDSVDTYNKAELVELDDTQGSFAYQGILGLAMPIEAAPGMSLTAEYRFMGLTSNRKYDGRVARSRFGAFPITTHVEDDFNHSILIGIRYAFDGL